jgi:hypothetical protein
VSASRLDDPKTPSRVLWIQTGPMRISVATPLHRDEPISATTILLLMLNSIGICSNKHEYVDERLLGETLWTPVEHRIGKVVSATGFEPATPCAQGKLGRPRKVLISEGFAAFEKSWAQFWAHPGGERS